MKKLSFKTTLFVIALGIAYFLGETGEIKAASVCPTTEVVKDFLSKFPKNFNPEKPDQEKIPNKTLKTDSANWTLHIDTAAVNAKGQAPIEVVPTNEADKTSDRCSYVIYYQARTKALRHQIGMIIHFYLEK